MLIAWHLWSGGDGLAAQVAPEAADGWALIQGGGFFHSEPVGGDERLPGRRGSRDSPEGRESAGANLASERVREPDSWLRVGLSVEAVHSSAQAVGAGAMHR